MAQPVYGLFLKTGGCSERMDGVWSKKVAMQLAALHRRTGRDVYARRIDIALTRNPTT